MMKKFFLTGMCGVWFCFGGAAVGEAAAEVHAAAQTVGTKAEAGGEDVQIKGGAAIYTAAHKEAVKGGAAVKGRAGIGLEKPAMGRNGIIHIKLEEKFGLGNRLKKIASYMRFYRPKHINLYWADTGWVNAAFVDLFSFGGTQAFHEFNAPELIENFPYSVEMFEYINEYSLLVAKTDFLPGVEPFLIDGKYHDIPENILNIYRPIFAKIKPGRLVKLRLATLNLPENTVAVQVRNAPDWQAAFKGNEDLRLFFREMDKYPPETKFFLSAMSKEVAAVFYLRYPGRILELPAKNYGSMIDAAADMFLLGQTEEAIYSLGSSFSEVGWWLGGAKAKVTLVGSYDHWMWPVNEVLPQVVDGVYYETAR